MGRRDRVADPYRLIGIRIHLGKKYYMLKLWGKPTLIILMGGGQIEQCDANISEKCLCSYHNNIALMEQISLFDTTLGKPQKSSFLEARPLIEGEDKNH